MILKAIGIKTKLLERLEHLWKPLHIFISFQYYLEASDISKIILQTSGSCKKSETPLKATVNF